MPSTFDYRPLLAATVLFLLLIGVFEAAVRWPARPVPRTLPAAASAPAADSGLVAAADTTFQVVTPAPAPEPPLPPCPDRPIRLVPPGPGGDKLVELRRYVGTVGGQRVTVLLQWRTDIKSGNGTLYWHRGGPLHGLAWSTDHLPALLDTRPDWPGQLEWQLMGRPVGGVLRGTWHGPTGRQPFALRENYAGGLRIDVHCLKLEGGQTYRPEYSPSDTTCQDGSYYYEYLQFPRPASVAPVLRQTIGAGPAMVGRRVRALFNDVYHEQREGSEFLLNDFYLLGYRQWRGSRLALDEHGDYWPEYYLFDLMTGRELTLRGQLRPGYERPLRRLLQRHLLHDTQFDFINKEHKTTWDWQDSTGRITDLVSLPEVDQRDNETGHTAYMVLTGSGLELTLNSYGLYDDPERAPRGQEHTIEIPYRELRPLVRPGTPLARMLRARGMW